MLFQRKQSTAILGQKKTQHNLGNDGDSLQKEQQNHTETHIPSFPQDQQSTTDNSPVFDQHDTSDDPTTDTNEMNDTEKTIRFRQENHKHLKEGDFSFNDVHNNPIYKANLKSDHILKNLKLSETCNICKECWYDLHIGKRNQLCTRCANEKKRMKKQNKTFQFSSENNMHPDKVPDEIKDLSFIELAAIRLIQPMFHVIQTKGGGLKMRGHCIAFEQDIPEFVTRLPHTPEKLPVLILRTRNEKNPKQFKANGQKIKAALRWLKEHNRFYSHIHIDEDALQRYPENDYVDGIPQEVSNETGPQKDACNPSMINEIDEINEVLRSDMNISEDLPAPESTIQKNYSKPTVLESMQKTAENITIAGDSASRNETSDNQEFLFPQLSKNAVSEFIEGFFTMCYPELFPTGVGDITLPCKGKKSSELHWLRHLIRFHDRRFSLHPTFVMSVVNRIQRHQALSVGNVYAKRSCPDISYKDLKENIDKGDFSYLKNLFYFGRNIQGSPQYFKSQATISANFLRHLRISSGDKKTFNLFLTWSAADYHWPELHRLFPNHEEYLGKKICKSYSDIPEGENKSQYIDKKTDILLRMKNVNEHSDIVNWFFIKKFNLLVENVFPILKITDYIARKEFQGRGAIHIHAIVSVDGDVTPKDLELAIKTTHYPNEPVTIQVNESLDNSNEETFASKLKTHDDIISAKNKVCHFAVNHCGLTSLHPNPDPNEWPETQPHVIDTDSLRLNYKDIYDSKEPNLIYEKKSQYFSTTHM